MKIAHIGNTAGIGTILANTQNKINHKTKVFVFDDGTHKMFGGERVNINSIISKTLFFTKIISYDLWHYHHPYGSLKNVLDTKHNKNRLLKHYHGDELRITLKSENDFCLVATPDLLQYAKNGVWLPSPIDFIKIQKFNSFIPKNNILKIAHYPYYKIQAGHTDHYSKVLETLQDRKRCEIIEILNMSHDEALQTINKCDIVIGKILDNVGWFGQLSLEAMALGKSIITFVSDELYKKYKPPIHRTTKETFEDDLNNLIQDEELRRSLGSQGLEYVKTNHNVNHTVNLLESYYRRILE